MSSRALPDALPASPELLRQFAEMADQQAFGSIVIRYAGWMTATAGRLTGDAALAQEIVQDAFSLLARKQPPFPSEAAMGAWLHRTVVFLARNQLAKRTRRQRGQRHYADAAADSVRSCQEMPREALRQLDALIATLPAADRQLITGRYFHELPWAALATEQGTSPEAVRKRAERILQRLATGLQSQGVRMSVMGLTMILTDHATASPTVAQAAAIAAGSVAGGSQLSSLTIFTHTLILMNTSKVITLTAALCALLFSIPLGMMAHRNHKMEKQLAGERTTQANDRKPIAKLNAPEGAAGGVSPYADRADQGRIPRESRTLGKIARAMAGVAAGASGPIGEVNSSLTEAVGAVMEDPDREQRVAALQFLLRWLRPVDVAAVRQAMEAKQKPGVLYVNEGNALLERQAQLMGREAMDEYVKSDINKAYNRLHAALVKGWAATDPDGLLEWLKALPPGCDWKDKASGDILRGLVRKDPARATELLLQSDPRSIAAGLPFIADRVLQSQGPEGLAGWLGTVPVNANTDQARARVAFQLVESQAFADPKAALASLLSFDNEPWGGAALAAQVGNRFGGASPERAYAMLDLLPSDSALAASLSDALFTSLARNQPNSAATWLNNNPDSPYADRAAETLARAVKNSDPAGAEAWARKIRQEDRRNTLLREMGVVSKE